MHTKGPWETSMGYIRAGSLKIANLSDGTAFEGTWKSAEQCANARLIASSPDLLEALEACQVRVFMHEGSENEAYQKARAAIQKARES